MRRGRVGVGLVLAGGLLLRASLAWDQAPTGDLASFLAAVQSLQRWGLHLYGHVNAFDPGSPFGYRNYSYPPGYLPWLWVSERVAGGNVRFWHLARIPPIAADLALAWVVARELGRRGATESMQVLGAAAIGFGPSFVVSSAIEGQIDAVAILPADVTALVWERGAGETLSSGTSSVAVAAAAVANGWCESPVTVHLAGGDLLVELDGQNARLTGPAQEICRGELSDEFEL